MYKFKKWIIGKADESRVAQVSKKFNISPLIAKIILLRGFTTDEEIENFLLRDKILFYNPFLLHDMEKSVDFIKSAIQKKLKIAVYGDYDVDGITSTYIVYDYLKSIGANAIYYIPDRAEEGYGINISAIDYLKSLNVNLVITVDVGITANDEIAYAKENGIDFIVTDHHTLKEVLPDCVGVINPKIENTYPIDYLAGVGVAFKLVYALSGQDMTVFDKYCDIAAIGTIADMVPLTDENRFIVKKGLEKLNNTKNIGLKALIEICGLSGREITASSVGFTLAPRLNAAGRLTSAIRSVELLLEKNKSIAIEIAINLDDGNKRRQNEEQKILKEALDIIYSKKLYEDDFIVVAKENWHHGVIGIVSSRITEIFYKPSAIISLNDDGTGKASGRSIKGFNLFDALNSCSQYLHKFGGHELAAGFTIYSDKIDDFRLHLNEYTRKNINDDISTPKIYIDSEIDFSQINEQTINELKLLEPCGIGNKQPVFYILDAKIKSIKYTQGDKKHAFITVEKNRQTIETAAFGIADNVKNFKLGDCICISGSLHLNTYKGVTYTQFVTRNITVGNDFKITKNILSDIFKVVDSNLKSDNAYISEKSFLSANKFSYNMSTILIALTVFSELDIIKFDFNQENRNVYVKKGSNYCLKNDLEKSKTYNLYKD